MGLYILSEVSHGFTCADSEGGGGGGGGTGGCDPLKNHKNKGFLSNIGPD